MRIKTFCALAAALAMAAGAQADIYKYRDPDTGKLVITNQPPPEGADIESQHKSAPPSDAYSPPPVQLEPAPDAPRKLVDVRPLELGETRVEPTTAWWKKHLTGYIENRSGLTTAHGVAVQTECSVGGAWLTRGQQNLGTSGPEAAGPLPYRSISQGTTGTADGTGTAATAATAAIARWCRVAPATHGRG